MNRPQTKEEHFLPMPSERRPLKTIYLLPNSCTTGALFCGFYAILSALEGRFQLAGLLLFAAMLLDGMDGRIARWTHSESEFGVQYDSLSDLVCFGVAPALILYEWSLDMIHLSEWLPAKLGWMACFVYTACAALRLARFNTQVGQVDKAIFIGLPSPAAAALVISFMFLARKLGWDPLDCMFPTIVLLIFAAIAMVSNWHYFSFKKLPISDRMHFHMAVLPVMLLGLIFLYPEWTVFSLFFLYAIHGPLWSVLRVWRQRRLT